MTTRWARWSGALLAGGAGLAAGFAAGCAATLITGRLISRGPLAAYPRLVAGLMGIAILVGVLLTLGVGLRCASDLRRLAARMDGIAVPVPPVAPPVSSAAGAQEAWRGQEAAPRQGTPVHPRAAVSSRMRTEPAFMIGGPEPLEPQAASAGMGWDRQYGAEGQKQERGTPPAAPGLARSDTWGSSANGMQGEALASGFMPVSERLVEIWARYLERGDGRFEPVGLQRQLEAAGLGGKVVAEDSLGEGVLGVDLDDGQVYLMPHFNCTPRAVAGWFDARPGATSRLARIQRLVQVAVARRSRSGNLELYAKGVVE
jgi:hypothetical protein